jgi:GTP-binding protein
VIVKVDHNLTTLSQYRTQRLIKAEFGEPGGTNKCAGKAGEDIYVRVPKGTLITVAETGEPIVDLIDDDQEFVIAKGGRGGFGNSHFAASTRQAPRISEPGEPGERLMVRLELKLVADIGLVGLPNAGKSTLLSVISNARPEIGDYAFTTLVPNLGVVDIDDTTMLVADIPGLIEGASQGKGLGVEFLRHIERTAVIIHLVDIHSENVAQDWKTVDDELAAYSESLAQKPSIVALTKCEGATEQELEAQRKILAKASGDKTYIISAQAHKGLQELLRAVLPLVEATRAARLKAEAEAVPIITEVDLPDAWKVEAEQGASGWRVTGQGVESFARRTNANQPDSLARMRDILRKSGVAKELRRRGAQPSDIIRIGALEFSWVEQPEDDY